MWSCVETAALQQTFSMFILQCVRRKPRLKFGAIFQYYQLLIRLLLQTYYIFKYDKMLLCNYGSERAVASLFQNQACVHGRV